MKNNIPKTSLLLIAVLLLNGCAMVSERQCREADWFSYGVSAGQRGASKDSYFYYIEACGKYQISVDTKAYARGYDEGLKTYCTPENADRIGSLGNKFRYELCPEEQKEKLAIVYYEQANNNLEQQVSTARLEKSMLEHDVEALKHEIDRLERRLAKSTHQQHAMLTRVRKIHSLIQNNPGIDANVKREIESLFREMKDHTDRSH